MNKSRIIWATSSLLSALAIVGCGSKGNTDMQTSSTVIGAKWDNFAKMAGLPTSEQAPVANNQAALVAHLTNQPRNFTPNFDDSNKVEYEAVKDAVNNYMTQFTPKTQAQSVVSIKRLSTVLKEAGFENQLKINNDKNFVSIPYIQRDIKDKNGKVTEAGKKVDLSGIKTISGIDESSRFHVYGTANGVLDTTQEAKGTVYVLTYKLQGVEQNYSAIITVPENASNLPLMMYAHGGDTGVSFRNMATMLQSQLNGAVVAAPSFPGEYICSVTTLSGNNKTNFQRYCGDENYNPVGAAVASEGKKSPLDDDVNALLGLHNAITKLSTGNIEVKDKASENIFINKKQPILAFNSRIPILMPVFGPQTIGVADSRGGATLLAAIGRSGIIIENLVKNLFGGDFSLDKLKTIPKPAFFSSAALYYSPSSLLIGHFRILTQYMINGDINNTSMFNALPMVPDLKNNAYFTNYRLAPLGNDKQQLNELMGWVAVSDLAYLAPYISVGMQNWPTNLDSIVGIANHEIGTVLSDLGKDEIISIVLKYLNEISKEIDSGKSMLNYFAEELRYSVNSRNNSNVANCNFLKEASDCFIYNIFVNGVEKDDVFAKEALPPLINKNDVESFADFLDVLGNKDLGLQVFLNPKQANSHSIQTFSSLLIAAKKANFPLSKLQDLVKYSVISMLSVSENKNSELASRYPDLASKANKIFIEFILPLSQNEDKVKEKISELFPKLKIKLSESLKKVKDTRKASPGSIVFLHSTQDVVVPLTQSIIAKTAMDKVFENIYGKNALTKSPLIQFGIPAIGSQLFAFQPEQKFYNLSVNGKNCKSLESDGTTPTNYSPDAGKCFGNLTLERNGDGNYAHGDTAFYTSRLLNSTMIKLNNATRDYKRKESADLKKAMLYGVGTDETGTPYDTFNDQISLFNKGYESNGDVVQNSPYPLIPFGENGLCKDGKITGVCYLAGVSLTNKIPLYNRTVAQDSTKRYSAILKGFWNSDAEKESNMTPYDVFSAWLDSSSKETRKVISN